MNSTANGITHCYHEGKTCSGYFSVVALALNGSYDQATLNTPPLTFGTHSFTAIYGGDGTFDQSTSTPATASVGSSVHGPLTITASEVEGEGAEYALTLPQHDLSSNTIQSWTIFWG
ncbi:MAG: Ig-like domain-containing protein, partial [Candidatus Sulfotelmatobacter sp.]